VAKLSVLTWIGNAAAALFGKHGSVTEQAQQCDCSRQTVYDHAAKVQAAVLEAQLPGPCRDDLLKENERLREENRQLWELADTLISFTEALQQKFTTASSAMGLSLSQIVALLTIVVGGARCPSRAKVGRWVQASSRRAGKLLQVLDRACQGLVLTLCLDEIFLHRQPLLMAVEPQSMAWVLGWRAGDRTGQTWEKALAAWPQLNYAVVDAGTGLQRGLKLALEARHQAKATVPLETNLDNFHIQQQGYQAMRRQWQDAEKVWQEADRATASVDKKKQQGQDARTVSPTATAAWQRAEKVYEEAEQQEAALKRVAAALQLFQADGKVNTRAAARRQVEEALQELPGVRWAKFCRMALDQRAFTFLDRLNRQLEQAEPRPEVRAAVLKLWQARHPWWAGQAATGRTARDAVQVAVRTMVCQKVAADWQESYLRVSAVLRGAVRASSVVECMNSVVRMHQGRHRGLSQELIDLKRLYWNCRAFAQGKRKKQCPYQHLGLRLPTYDWWELLQMSPDELEQKLSSTKLAA
jgi:tetratricopeptide (TPR) repeat protein